MGVPSLNRWFADKYPKAFVAAAEETAAAVDTTLPNPNGMEFDNLYIDMNRVIHPCFNTEDNLFPPATFGEVFNHTVKYIDRIFRIVRPRKLLYMAIDGVAPRAKINQQRARRYKTAKDSEFAEKEEERLRRQYQMEDKSVLPKEKSEVSDPNIVTPGTEFMFRLSKDLQVYIRHRMDRDPGWEGIKVILSDANVPGEGEHKIMSFIRLQRTFPDYNPDTRHCLYGLDADLIMLALATHELHISILREDLLVQDREQTWRSTLKHNPLEAGQSSVQSGGWFEQVLEESHKELSCSEICSIYRRKPLDRKPFVFIHVSILREYLEHDMKSPYPPKGFVADLERIIDDFIFICFFAGNDFLPHLPTIEIPEGGIDLLMHVYRKEFKNFGGYLVDMKKADEKNRDFLNLKRVEKFILRVGTFEEAIFKKRSEVRKRKLRGLAADSAVSQEDDETEVTCDQSSCIERSPADNNEILQNTIELKKKINDNTNKRSAIFPGCLTEDKVRLGMAGWKERYYKEKFSADGPEEVERMRQNLVETFTEGLCWLLLYYYSGVASWTWFYPFYYGPFASDMKGLALTESMFEPGLPLKPFDQLMAVLPPTSAHALPPSYRSLMTDENSSISGFYPNDIEIDTDGKRYLSQGVYKLPFIDTKRLLAETEKLEKELTEEESIRNAESLDHLFMQRSSPLGSKVALLYKNLLLMSQDDIEIESSKSNGINGFVSLKLNGDGFSEYSNAISVFYKPPPFNNHSPVLLQGVTKEERSVYESDIMQIQLWHKHGGCWQSYSFRSDNTNWRSSISSMNRDPKVETSRVYPDWSLSSLRWDAFRVDGENEHRSMKNLQVSGLPRRSNSYGRDHKRNDDIRSFRPYGRSHAYLENTSQSDFITNQNSHHPSSTLSRPKYDRWQMDSDSWQNNKNKLSWGRSSNGSSTIWGRGRGRHSANQSDRGWDAFNFDGKSEPGGINKLRMSDSLHVSNSYGKDPIRNDNGTSSKPYGKGHAWVEKTSTSGRPNCERQQMDLNFQQTNNERSARSSSSTSTWARTWQRK